MNWNSLAGALVVLILLFLLVYLVAGVVD